MNILYRIFIGLIIFALVFWGQWLIALPIAFVCLWIFPNYVEIIFAGIVYDSLFGLTQSSMFSNLLGLSICIFLFVSVKFFKQIVRR